MHVQKSVALAILFNWLIATYIVCDSLGEVVCVLP